MDVKIIIPAPENRTRRVNRLKELRKQRGLTLSDLGKMTDQSFASVQRQEKGTRGISQELAQRYAEIFQIQPDELFIHPDIREEDLDEESKEKIGAYTSS